MKSSNVFAKIIRTITIPTLLFLLLLLISYFANDTVFLSIPELLVPLLCIGVFPLFAYLLAFILTKNKDKDIQRKNQRKLAFIFSLVGYTLSFILVLSLNMGTNVKILSSTYFFSVLFLTNFNVFHVKASGHASGITGPMLLLCYYIGWIYLIPCVIVYALSLWSSLYLKRHTLTQYILGTICASLAFVVSILIF